MRTSDLAAVAAGILATMAVPASAEEPVPLEPAKLLFGSPGELTFDCSVPDGVIEVKDSPREFADWQEYAAFLTNELNAVPTWDGNEVAGFELTTTSYCETLYVDPSLAEPVKTDWPALAILGGTSGYVFVADKAICVNPEICEPRTETTQLMVAANMAMMTSIAREAEASGGYQGIGVTTDRQDPTSPPQYPQYLSWVTSAWRDPGTLPSCCKRNLNGGCMMACRPTYVQFPANLIANTAFGYEGGNIDAAYKPLRVPYCGEAKRYLCGPVADRYLCRTTEVRHVRRPAEPAQFIFESTLCAHHIEDANWKWDLQTCTQMHKPVACPTALPLEECAIP